MDDNLLNIVFKFSLNLGDLRGSNGSFFPFFVVVFLFYAYKVFAEVSSNKYCWVRL